MDTNNNTWNMAAYRAMVAGIVFKLCATFFILVVLGFLYTCYAQVLPTYATIATQYAGADSLQHRIGADSIYIRSNKPIALKGYWPGTKIASVVNGFVPYTGATADVDIYPYRFTASWLTSDYVDTGSLFLTDRKIYDGSGDSVMIREGLSGTMAYLSDVPNPDDFVQASDTSHFKTDYNFVQGVDYQAPLSDVLQGTGSYPKYTFWSDISGFLGQSLYEDDTITRIINDIDSLASFNLANVVSYSGNTDDLDMGIYNISAEAISAELAELTDLSLSGVVVSNGGLDTFYLPAGGVGVVDTFAMVSNIPTDYLTQSDTVGLALRSWVQTFYQPVLTNPLVRADSNTWFLTPTTIRSEITSASYFSLSNNTITTTDTIQAPKAYFDILEAGDLVLSGGQIDNGSGLTWTLPASSGTFALTSQIGTSHDPVSLGTNNTGLTLLGQELTLPAADGDTNGALTSTDWNTFNNKLSAMIYPGSGIAVSTGTGWGTSITNNSSNWNDAYSWGNHEEAGYLNEEDLEPYALITQLHDSVTIGTANGLSLSAQQLSLASASGSTTGALTSADWLVFNGKQDALTNPVTGTGVSNKLALWNSTSTITNTEIKTLGGETLIGAGNIDFPLVAYDTTEITTTIDFSTNRIFYRTISGTTTFTATNLQANKDVVLKLTVTGTPTINFTGLIGEQPFFSDITAYIGLKGVNTTQYIVTFINEL